MTKNNIEVSIYCVTYNHEKYIKKTIESFLDQKTNFDFEILIGEDCSLDDTGKIVDEYVNKYPNKIKKISSDKNVGGKKNFLRLHDHANGKYVALCEGDDYWIDPYKLQKQYDYMENNIDCSFCSHSGYIISNNIRKNMKLYKKNRKVAFEDVVYNKILLPTASLFYRKSYMDNPPDFYFNSDVLDYPMKLILISKGYGYYLNKKMSVYRRHVKGSWTMRVNSSKENILNHYNKLINTLKAYNEYTNFKYEDIINEVILMRKIDVMSLEKDFKVLKKDRKYIELIKKMPIKIKLKYMFKINFPKFFDFLRRVKNKYF